MILTVKLRMGTDVTIVCSGGKTRCMRREEGEEGSGSYRVTSIHVYLEISFIGLATIGMKLRPARPGPHLTVT